jgi:hypothetical protein
MKRAVSKLLSQKTIIWRVTRQNGFVGLASNTLKNEQ